MKGECIDEICVLLLSRVIRENHFHGTTPGYVTDLT